MDSVIVKRQAVQIWKTKIKIDFDKSENDTKQCIILPARNQAKQF